MMFGFKKKDPICGMKETKDKGMTKHGNWFCSQACVDTYEKKIKNQEKGEKHGCCK